MNISPLDSIGVNLFITVHSDQINPAEPELIGLCPIHNILDTVEISFPILSIKCSKGKQSVESNN